jgi:hypothetical protein
MSVLGQNHRSRTDYGNIKKRCSNVVFPPSRVEIKKVHIAKLQKNLKTV